MPHYHIRWSTKEVLDWAAFPTRAEAEASAAQLVRRGETYTIEERDDTCPRCLKSFNLKRVDVNPNHTYPWQQAVLDALNEPNPQQRIRKISKAQQAISARLTTLAPRDTDEQAAIREAVRTLRSLGPERKNARESSEKKDIA